MKKTKKNAQDATLRNVRAATKQIASLIARVTTLEETMQAIQTQVASLALPTQPQEVAPDTPPVV